MFKLQLTIQVFFFMVLSLWLKYMFYDYDIMDEAPTSVYLGKNNNNNNKKKTKTWDADINQLSADGNNFVLLSSR